MKLSLILSIFRLLFSVLLLGLPSIQVFSNSGACAKTDKIIGFNTETVKADYAISGIVHILQSSAPFAGVSISFPGVGDVVTDEDGYYEIIVPEGWSGAAVPQSCNENFYNFDPPQISYTNVMANFTDQNYTAEATAVFTISGTITDKDTGEPLANKQVTFSKSAGGPPWNIVVQTNALGEYSFEQYPCWNNTLNPGVDGFFYLEPFTRSYVDLSSDMPNQDYTFINYEKPVPPNWNYTQTGQAHIIAIQNTSFPNLCGTPIELGDLIGVFYYDFDNVLKCGGYGRWQDESNVALIAQGDDNLTPTIKDGFASYEIMNWRIYSYATETEYSATPTYQTGGFLNSNNKFSSGGLSIVTAINAFYPNVITLPQGWSGLSSYTKPNVQLLITNVMAPIMNELVIIQDMEKVYYPAGGINNMLIWTYNKGYKIKVNQEVDLPMTGCQQDNTTINLSSTWNILPVMSQCEVDPLELFAPVIDKILIVKEIAGTGVYWPEMGIQSLTVLEPGRAYYVAVNQSTSVTYAPCENVKQSTSIPADKSNSFGPWGNPVLSGSSHTFAFTGDAMKNLHPGDFIGAITQDNFCYGFIEITEQNQNIAMTTFGDDLSTTEKDGFSEGELISFKVLKSGTNEEVYAEVDFSGNYPSSDGRFTDNGLSVIDYLNLNSSGLTTIENAVNFYPNPSSGHVELISKNNETYRLTIQNMSGQILLENTFSGNSALNLSDFNKGIYVVKIENGSSSFTKKLILK